MKQEINETIRELKALPYEEQMARVNAMTPEEHDELRFAMDNDPAYILRRKTEKALDDIKHGRPWSME